MPYLHDKAEAAWDDWCRSHSGNVCALGKYRAFKDAAREAQEMTWRPHPGPQTDFCQRGEYEALFGGSAGPGKTDCLIWEAARYRDNPRYRALILRRTYPQLQEIEDRCYQYLPDTGAQYRAGERRWYWPSGAFLKLGHMQHEADRYNYHGHQYHWVGWDELTQFTYAQYSFLTFSRARTTDPDMPPQVRATSNPGGIGHRWVKARFIDPMPAKHTYIDPESGLSRIFIPAKVTDNPTLVEADPAYISRLMMLPEMDRRRLLDGDWDIFEGQVFQDLDQRIHGCEPFELPPEWEYFGSLDWGYSNPFSYGVYGVDHDENLYRVMEWYGGKEGDEANVGLRMVAADVADGILEREAKLGVKVRYRIGDKSMWNALPGFRQKEAIGKDLVEDFSARGCHIEKSDSDRIQGWQQVHKRFSVDRIVDEDGEVTDERPTFQAFNDQEAFWRLMPEMYADERNPEDIDKHQEAHIADEFRYACMHRPLVPKRKAPSAPGSFQDTRTKHIRARKLAQRLGISLSQAYLRIR